MKKFSFKNLLDALIFGLFLAFIKFMQLLSLGKARKLCSFIMRRVGPLTPTNKIINTNLKYIYPEISKQEIKKLEEQIWDNFGRYIGEFAFLDEKFLKTNSALVEIEGKENIEKLLKANEAFIIFTGHLANWDFVLFALLAIMKEASVIYRKVNNKFIDNYVRKKRALAGANLICKGTEGVRDLIKSLKNNRNLVMLVDQKMNEGIKVPFMGKPAMTGQAIAVFAREYNYALLPVRVIRKKDGNYKLIFCPSFKVYKTADKETDIYQTMEKINDTLGEWVYAKPGQWFWMHQRWGKIHELDHGKN